MRTINYLLEEIKQNKMISKNQKNTYATFNCFEKLVIFAFTITRCVHVSVFACLIDISVGTTSFVVGLKFVQQL